MPCSTAGLPRLMVSGVSLLLLSVERTFRMRHRNVVTYLAVACTHCDLFIAGEGKQILGCDGSGLGAYACSLYE